MGKKILYILIIIILIIAGIFVAKQMSEENEITRTGANTVENTVKNNNKNEIELKNTIESEVNEIENNNIQEETTTGFNPEEQAKQIARDNWGEDDTVYFSYDGKDENGRYIICVREQSSTKALYWYYVDIETGTFDIK